MKTVKSPKGNDLPLTNLKGKDYLMVAYRLQWLNEATAIEKQSFSIDTVVLNKTENEATVRATVSIFDESGRLLRTAPGTKTETQQGFADFLEKAETGAIGRALAMIGYGTQFALADLDEGARIVDSPVVDVKAAAKENGEEKPKKNTFRRPAVTVVSSGADAALAGAAAATPDGWDS